MTSFGGSGSGRGRESDAAEPSRAGAAELPSGAPGGQAAEGPGGAGPGGHLPQGRPTLLLVEDDAAQALALRELLAQRFRVCWAEDGTAALRLARAELPELVLLDRALPGLDGLAVFAALRQEGALADTPVVFLSGEGDEAAAVRCLELGAADYVRKPASPRELLARLERALREADQRRALRALAQTDALTGLANFRSLRARMDEEFKRARRYRHALALVMVDLDNLKAINDRWGHDVGNRAILALARHLRANLREVDFAARFGGDEFVVLLPHQTAPEAAVFAERVRAGLGEVRVPVADAGPLTLGLSISLGVAEHSEAAPKASPEALLKAADDALYLAKRAGRDRLALHGAEAGLRPTVGADSRH